MQEKLIELLLISIYQWLYLLRLALRFLSLLWLLDLLRLDLECLRLECLSLERDLFDRLLDRLLLFKSNNNNYIVLQ